MRVLYMAHSGLRFLVFLMAVVSLVTLVYAVVKRRDVPATRGLTAAYTGLIHLQGLLGIGLVVAGVWYPALMGHVVMMVLAIAAVTVTSARARRTTDPLEAQRTRLLGVILSLGLIVVGIIAIGRGLFESRAMTGG